MTNRSSKDHDFMTVARLVCEAIHRGTWTEPRWKARAKARIQRPPVFLKESRRAAPLLLILKGQLADSEAWILTANLTATQVESAETVDDPRRSNGLSPTKCYTVETGGRLTAQFVIRGSGFKPSASSTFLPCSNTVTSSFRKSTFQANELGEIEPYFAPIFCTISNAFITC